MNSHRLGAIYASWDGWLGGRAILALTKKCDYALIALAHLVRAGDRSISAREIAGLYHLSQPLLMNVLKQLTRHGLVRSSRGVKGGYALSVDAEALTLDRLLDAVEGPLRLSRCVPREGSNGSACDLLATCPIRTPVQRVQGRLREFLSGITLREIASDWPEPAPQDSDRAGAHA